MNRYIKIIVTAVIILAVVTTASIFYIPKTAKADTYETNTNIEKMYTLKASATTTSTMTMQSTNREIEMSVDWEIIKNTSGNYGTYNINVIRRKEETYSNNTSAITYTYNDSGTWRQIIYISKTQSATSWNQSIYGIIYEKTSNVCQTDYYLSKILTSIYMLGDFEVYTPEATADGNFTYTYGYIPYNIGENGREYGQGVSNSIQRNTADTGGFYLQIPNIQGYSYVQIAIQVEHTNPYELMYKDPYLYALNFMNIMPVNNTIRVDYANQAFTEPVEYTISNDGLVEQTNENWSGLISIIQFDVQLSGTDNNAIIANIPFASQSYINGYKSAIQYIEAQKQSAYNRGYAEGLGTAETGDFYHLISAVFSVPVSVITGFADVNILGVNMLTVLRGLLTICIIAMVLKFFI